MGGTINYNLAIMKLVIRDYRTKDLASLRHFMEQLQDHLIPLDPMKRLRRTKDYGRYYTADVLKKVKTDKGKIYLAELDGKPVGVAAGITRTQNIVDRVSHVPTKAGILIELFVNDAHRGKSVGSALMKKLEDYFRSKKCNVIRLEVLEFNSDARKFYKKCGFTDRVIDMTKLL